MGATWAPWLRRTVGMRWLATGAALLRSVEIVRVVCACLASHLPLGVLEGLAHEVLELVSFNAPLAAAVDLDGD